MRWSPGTTRDHIRTEMASPQSSPRQTRAPQSGLKSAEARARLREFGPNQLARESGLARLTEPLKTLADPMALMLAAAAIVYHAVGENLDAIVLMCAIVPVLAVDVILEARAREALKKLAQAVAPRATVVRDGAETEVASEAIVPGDLMLLDEGGVAHADGVARVAAHLAVDESQLTGEAEPVPKEAIAAAAGAAGAPEWSRVYAGSRVVAGYGWVEVTATGPRTRYGKIAQMVTGAETRLTPLQRKTAALVRRLAVGAVTAASWLFIIWRTRGADSAHALLFAISLAMSAVCEEFLLVLTMFLSLGAWRLSRLGVLVKRLASVETLGATTVICLDKTGTLTAGDFILTEHRPLAASVSEDELLEAAVLACEPDPADSMERRIVEHCADHRVDVPALLSQWKLIYDHPFDLAGKHMSHAWRSRNDGRDRIVAKGALEGVLEHCDVTAEERRQAEAVNQEMARRGMRVLAVAGRATAAGGQMLSGIRTEDERGLHLFGLLGFQDPMREQVPAAVAESQRAGIRLKLISGDHALTAHAIADASGLIHSNDGIITGPELTRLSASAFDAAVRRCSIFARVLPEQKFAIVDSLIRGGEVVAMTGDGINDAPAMRRADIAVSMGRRATEAARAVAGLVLLEDDFSAMVATVREGRQIYANIQRAFLYLIGFKVMLVAMALVAPLAGLPILLAPVSLVWLELIVHPVSALAFEGEAPSHDVMLEPPRDPEAPIVGRAPAIRAAISGLILAGAAVALFAGRLALGRDYARTVAMTVAIAGSLAMVFAQYASGIPGNELKLPRRLQFWAVIACAGLSLPIFIAIRPLATIMMIQPIGIRDVAIALAAALGAVVWRAVGNSFSQAR
jgi:P-type Ca2+ transporter type 2C